MHLNSLVPLVKLAEELGVDRSNARKIALKMGFEPVRRQVPGIGHRQRTLTWTREQVDQIVAARRRAGFEVGR